MGSNLPCLMGCSRLLQRCTGVCVCLYIRILVELALCTGVPEIELW